MMTLAVVCDENIEVHEDRDEKLCASGGGANGFVYAGTFCAGMLYVILKLNWWFRQRHLPLEDEDDDNDIQMEEETGA